MTTNDLQAQIDAEAARIRAFNDHEQTWQDCPQQDPTHRNGHYCEHQVIALANHLVRNRIQREDAQKQALVRALEESSDALSELDGGLPDIPGGPADGSGIVAYTGNDAWYGIRERIQAALKGLEQPPSTRFFRNEAGVLDEHRKEKPSG